jgi:hypothetical protein
MWKKANIHKRYVRNFTLHWQSSRWKACEAHFQQTYVNGVWLWIESYIREFRESKIYDIFTFLPCSYPLLYGFPTCWHPFHHKGSVTCSPRIARKLNTHQNNHLYGKIGFFFWISTLFSVTAEKWSYSFIFYPCKTDYCFIKSVTWNEKEIAP